MPEEQATYENTNPDQQQAATEAEIDATQNGETQGQQGVDVSREAVYSVYNPYTHEHLYTSDLNEYNVLTTEHGWQAEGQKMNTPETSTEPVYRLYNPETGQHHYAYTEDEYTQMADEGWNAEGIAFFEDDAATQSQVSGDGSANMSQIPNSQSGNNQQVLDSVQQYNQIVQAYDEEIARMLQERNQLLQQQFGGSYPQYDAEAEQQYYDAEQQYSDAEQQYQNGQVPDEPDQQENNATVEYDTEAELDQYRALQNANGMLNSGVNMERRYAAAYLGQIDAEGTTKDERRSDRSGSSTNQQQQAEEDVPQVDFSHYWDDPQYA